MAKKHDIFMEGFRFFMSVLAGGFMGGLVLQAGNPMPVVMVTATVSAGVTLGLLRAYDP